jgi:hypothetical protein
MLAARARFSIALNSWSRSKREAESATSDTTGKKIQIRATY